MASGLETLSPLRKTHNGDIVNLHRISGLEKAGDRSTRYGLQGR